MALSVQDALFHASHTLGHGTTGEQSPVGGLFILNYAGNWLVNSHSWHWMLRPEVTLDFHKDIEYVWLPLDFGEMVGYDVTSGLASSLSMTTHQHLVDLRTSSITTSTWRYWCAVTQDDRGAKAHTTITCDDNPTDSESISLVDGVNPTVNYTFSTTAGTIVETAVSREVVIGSDAAATAAALTDAINATPLLYIKAVDSTTAATINLEYATVGTVGNLGTESSWLGDGNNNFSASADFGEGVDPGQHRARLDIWPAPTADEAGALTIYYRGRWRQIDEDTRIIPVPTFMEPLYIDAVRAFARGFEMQDEKPMIDWQNELRASAAWDDAVKADGQTQHIHGQMTGGAVTSVSRQRNPSHLYNFAAVPDQ